MNDNEFNQFLDFCINLHKKDNELFVKEFIQYGRTKFKTFDFVNVGDLIKDKFGVFEVNKIEYIDNKRFFVSQPAHFKHHEEEILEIYKKNNDNGYSRFWHKVGDSQ